jgi:protein-tyrosine phosphatase
VGAVSGRLLTWEGCVNVRDLGGLLTESGGHTRPGAVVRADNIRHLTTAGWERAVSYGVRHVIDLRFPGENPGDPELHEAVVAVGIPLFGEHNPTLGQPLEEALRSNDDVGASFGLDYVRSLQEHQRQFGAAVAAVAEADGIVVVHCFAGKDRTGLVAALLLSVAGATDDAIVSDYALSEPNMDPLLGEWIESAVDDDDRRLRSRLGQAPSAAMTGVLAWLRREGGADAYLREAGVGDDDLGRLRARLA